MSKIAAETPSKADATSPHLPKGVRKLGGVGEVVPKVSTDM
ncbi:hypothetical protein PCS_00228 [Desulfocurvibacter africanus PCS]|uniref:Uncharacterized protein n=1 Tax=Desulfocurvibacter africanus PCS TaxID=1262666 RepID=M5Q3K3_DESAF|nr:hypothetical protein [Desulfocurvibacter africanus]EMG38598.1 hypothetical protein PCS_00228 [Desulfocurvibacter africanus PCS]